ncbi:MAG: hypothetical protein COU25_00985 [Candidatus Levybacteria bacterium CG10_big_fil_rev_8_21_14_0_10_35_13]|nr:MAG: hypothetical protein COU25_00985 [Candidatus Levybacteria bacterium CG10_big_fil_rev_8_21_14_0_10_35_13]
MKKVCIISSKFFPIVGGGETHTFQIAKALSEKEFEVTVITNDNGKLLPKNLPFKIIRIDGFDDEHIDINTSIPSLYKILKNINPEIIHVHNYEPYLIFSLFSESFKDKKIILTIHNTPFFPKRVFGTFKDFDAEFATAKHLIDSGIQKHIVVASNYYRDSIKSIATTLQSIQLISYGVDFKLFDFKLKSSFRKRFKLLKNDILITCPSRIIVRKGIKEAVECLSYLPNNFKLFLPASFEPKDLSYFQEIKRLINMLNLNDRVILANKQYAHGEMPNIYQASDVVIMPSYYEGFGFAILEAMAMKKPVVGTDVVGINEAIRNEVDGLLIPAKDIKALSNAILRIVSDKLLKDNLIRNAFNKVQTSFELDKQVNQLIKLYEP